MHLDRSVGGGSQVDAANMLRIALEAVPCGILMVDSQSRITLINDQIEGLFGYSPEELIGQSMNMLIPQRLRDRHRFLQENYFAYPDSRPMGSGRELSGLRRDGSEFPVEVGLSVVNTVEGCFVLSTVVDISERRRLQAALVHSQKMDALGQLASGVAHDFNNVLMSISGCMNLLQAKHVVSESGKRLILEGQRAVKRGVSLTSRLLAFSRETPLATEIIDINRLIDEMKDLMTRTVDKGCRMSFRLGADLWPVKGDRQQIELALINLIINARDAMMSQAATITIETQNALVAGTLDGIATGEYVVLKVIDTGCGIPPNLLSRVIEPFYTTKPPGKGTGLGLSMVHGVMHQLGGGLRIASTVGVGTTVSIYLPRHVPSDHRDT